MNYSAVILAAGKGVRMHSQIPKVLHRVAGKPMIWYVVKAVEEAGINDITLVVGHGREIVEETLSGETLRFVVQEQQLGTGHALMQAQGSINSANTLVVLSGDTPLLEGNTLKKLLDFHQQQQALATVLSGLLPDPYGYGRIIRQADGGLERIIEEKDASPEEKEITEINTGMYCFQAGAVFAALSQIECSNAQGEYYLTDVLPILKKDGHKVAVLATDKIDQIHGINDRVQMAQAETIIRQRHNQKLMKNGVTIMAPETTFIDSSVKIGMDTVVYPFTIIEGQTTIGENCTIGPSTRINDSSIGNYVVIENSRVKEACIGNHCNIGPFAYLRPEANLQDNVKVGDFVEIKKSIIGAGSKIPHLSYVGDALLGKEVNIGAGTITCNYDGKKKSHTILEDGVFIGSNTNLVAPVTIGKNSMTGAGSTITHDIPAHTLAVERAEQKHIRKKGN
ncbi:MAG TPA: bifunctional UDP-N-acetylglucosamine diphosphorylase/glucosamine-1-phosphate N-acetyltransferase GlmU [Syntrophomonas sp.]|nr:bifunctional UDP-N-acetylglucosamine diphosphorylase/glucosamine-1-phosphate N-acetyltransferase GlmU [Syntrophomonas sp.]